MKKLLTNVGIQLASSAAAILLADIFLARFSVNIGGFIIAVMIFTLAQSMLERLIPKLAAKHVPALMERTMWIST